VPEARHIFYDCKEIDQMTTRTPNGSKLCVIRSPVKKSQCTSKSSVALYLLRNAVSMVSNRINCSFQGHTLCYIGKTVPFHDNTFLKCFFNGNRTKNDDKTSEVRKGLGAHCSVYLTMCISIHLVESVVKGYSYI
jgi:hypothetical protein